MESMCQILKMSYSNGSIVVEVSSGRELTKCVFELYLYDFLKGEYNSKAGIKQAIGALHISQDSGIYRFKYEIPGNCKVKCVIAEGDTVLVSKERYIGDRHTVKVDAEPSEIGYLYKMKSDISISKKLIFYKSPVSSTKINLPDDLISGETLVFTIKDRNFKPKFECFSDFVECFNIEG